jgi:hypothetical protein
MANHIPQLLEQRLQCEVEGGCVEDCVLFQEVPSSSESTQNHVCQCGHLKKDHAAIVLYWNPVSGKLEEPARVPATIVSQTRQNTVTPAARNTSIERRILDISHSSTPTMVSPPPTEPRPVRAENIDAELLEGQVRILLLAFFFFSFFYKLYISFYNQCSICALI